MRRTLQRNRLSDVTQEEFDALVEKVIADARARGCVCAPVQADFAVVRGGKTVTVEILHSVQCPLDEDYYAEVL